MSNEQKHRNRLPAFENDEELTAFARDYFSNDFPNSSLADCPTLGDLKQIISECKLPSDELRRHLLGCSNCFQIYRNALAGRNGAVTIGSGWRALGAFMRASVVVPIAAALVLLIVIGVCILYVRSNRSKNYVASDGQTYSPIPATPQSEQSPDLSARNAVQIDFNNYRVQRGGKNGENPTTEVSRASVAFAITLPEGSPGGKYAVRLEDPNGKAVKEASVQAVDRKILKVDIDFSKLAPKKYRLCVSRKSESPNCYPIVLK